MKYVERNKQCLTCVRWCIFVLTLLTGVSIGLFVTVNQNPCVFGHLHTACPNKQCCQGFCTSTPNVCQPQDAYSVLVPSICLGVFGTLLVLNLFLICCCKSKSQPIPFQLQLEKMLQEMNAIKEKKADCDKPQGNKRPVVIEQVDSQLNVQQVVYMNGVRVQREDGLRGGMVQIHREAERRRAQQKANVGMMNQILRE